MRLPLSFLIVRTHSRAVLMDSWTCLLPHRGATGNEAVPGYELPIGSNAVHSGGPFSCDIVKLIHEQTRLVRLARHRRWSTGCAPTVVSSLQVRLVALNRSSTSS